MSLIQQMFRRKISAEQEQPSGLKQCLGAWDLALLGIGAVIGTGIFVLTGVAAATQAGPAVVLSFVVAGLASGFAALAYSEMAASVGGVGSAYGYSYAAFGEFIAWIIGWDLVLEYGVATAAVSVGWSGYFNSILTAIGMPLPPELLNGPWAATPGIVNLPAVMIIGVMTALLVAGVRESARLNAAIVFIKLLAISVFIVIAAFHVNPDNWTPFMPFGWFGHNDEGHTIGILAGASLVFFAYMGFDAVSTAVGECRKPQRDVPIGMLSALGVCTILYILVSGLLTGIVPYTDLNVPSPVAYGMERLGINWASALISTGAITGLTTAMLVCFYALTRVLLGISRDGLLPGFFGKVCEKTHTPVNGTLLCGVIIALMAGFVPLGILAELVNVGTLFAFVLVCGGVMVLRRTHPEMPRPFRIPGVYIVCTLGIVSCLALIAFLPAVTHIRFLLWLLAGVAIYFLYGARRSALRDRP